MENFQDVSILWQALRARHVCGVLGISRATLYRWIKQNRFPQPFSIGANSVAWDSRQVAAWLEERKIGKEVA